LRTPFYDNGELVKINDGRGNVFVRLVYEGANTDGDAFTFRGYMAYQSQLFGVSMLVRENGTVEMLDDDPMGFIVRLN
jgi:hypothetical protein